MIFHKTTYNDICKYYSDNIVKLPCTGDRLWQIFHIDHDEVRLRDMDGFEIYLDLSEEYEIDYPLPGRVVYQDGPQAVMLARKPAQQYNRGLHTKNTQLSQLRAIGDWSNCGFSIQKLQQFVDKPAYQTIAGITHGDCDSVALNRYFSVARVGTLFVLNKAIGTVDTEAKKVSCHKLFHEDVKPLFPADWSFV